MEALLIRNRVDLVLRTDPPESRPAPGLITVARRLSPTIVVNCGITIGNDTSSYVPPFTKITAGEDEDDKLCKIKNHSYITINSIISIDEETDSIEIIDKDSVSYNSFQNFLSNDLYEGAPFSLKLLDPGVSKKIICVLSFVIMPVIKSCVVLTFLFVIEIVSPTAALTKVDLPALVFPITLIFINLFCT